MDELAAAAAVLAMDVGPDADEETVQENSSGACGGDVQQQPTPSLPVAGEENQISRPEQREPGTDFDKVMMRLRTLAHAPHSLSFTCYWHPADLP
jgi:hypothetical protein